MADEAALDHWLAEDPAHTVQFQLATDVWSAPGSFPLPPPSRSILRPILALTFVLVVAVASVIAYFRPSDVVTRVGERRTVILADGIRVELNTNTRIRGPIRWVPAQGRPNFRGGLLQRH